MRSLVYGFVMGAAAMLLQGCGKSPLPQKGSYDDHTCSYKDGRVAVSIQGLSQGCCTPVTDAIDFARTNLKAIMSNGDEPKLVKASQQAQMGLMVQGAVAAKACCNDADRKVMDSLVDEQKDLVDKDFPTHGMKAGSACDKLMGGFPGGGPGGPPHQLATNFTAKVLELYGLRIPEGRSWIGTPAIVGGAGAAQGLLMVGDGDIETDATGCTYTDGRVTVSLDGLSKGCCSAVTPGIDWVRKNFQGFGGVSASYSAECQMSDDAYDAKVCKQKKEEQYNKDEQLDMAALKLAATAQQACCNDADKKVMGSLIEEEKVLGSKVDDQIKQACDPNALRGPDAAKVLELYRLRVPKRQSWIGTLAIAGSAGTAGGLLVGLLMLGVKWRRFDVRQQTLLG